MTDPRPPRDPARRRDGSPSGPSAEAAWSAGSGMLSGVLLFGGLGWLVGHAVGSPWPVAAGVLVGAGVAFAALWFRYGVDRPPDR